VEPLEPRGLEDALEPVAELRGGMRAGDPRLRLLARARAPPGIASSRDRLRERRSSPGGTVRPFDAVLDQRLDAGRRDAIVGTPEASVSSTAQGWPSSLEKWTARSAAAAMRRASARGRAGDPRSQPEARDLAFDLRPLRAFAEREEPPPSCCPASARTIPAWFLRADNSPTVITRAPSPAGQSA
jgi:hypothetical protein